MDIITRAVRYVNHLDSLGDSRSASTLLLRSSWIPLSALVIYVLFVLWIGPRFMANRKPYRLTKTIMVYNIIQVIANTYLVLKLSWPHLQFSIWCSPHPYYETKESKDLIYYSCYYYYVLKILDFTDTFFFVLRKKQNQITFLHVYHHIAVLMLAWIGATWFPGGSKMLALCTNALVHSIMYSYYFLSALHLPGVSIFKPYVTRIQLVQFFLINTQLILTLILGLCEESRAYTISIVAFNITMIILFTRFYNRSYKRQGHAGFVHKME